MPSTRIQVSLKPEVYAAVDRLADLQNRPTSKLVAEMVELVLPHLEQQVQNIESFKPSIAADLEQASSRAAGRTINALALGMAGQSQLPELGGDGAPGDQPSGAGFGGGGYDGIARVLNAGKHQAPNPINKGATSGETPKRGSNLTPPKKRRKGGR